MQQINLYQPILRKQQKVFSARTLLLGNLLILGGLLLLYGYTQLQTRTLQVQFDSANTQRDERHLQLQQAVIQYPAPRAETGLPARVEAARTEVRQQQSLLQAMQRYDTQPEQRFSAQLQGLSQQVRGSIWLTTIQLQPGQVHLRGMTDDAEQVPRLVQALREEEAFSGLSFEQVVIFRETDNGLLGFSLNTRRDTDAPLRSGGRP